MLDFIEAVLCTLNSAAWDSKNSDSSLLISLVLRQ
jgi:hypothetical protein